MQTTMNRLASLFRSACDHPRTEWSGILAMRCDDTFTRQRVVALLATDAATQPLRQVGRYVLRDLIGSGGMGAVYRASDPVLGRDVALKLLGQHLASEAARRQFAAEAMALGRLRHPGIATVHDAGVADCPHGPQPYIAMELVDGLPISDYARRHRLDRARRVALLADVADALEHAHQRGVIHRDLKPHNVLVMGDPKSPRVALVDFGVARIVDGERSHEGEGQVVGTLRYMSPEQAAGSAASVDHRTDVYSLGVLACELLTGKVPLEPSGDSVIDDLRTIAAGPTRSLRELDPSLPPALARVLQRALRRTPGRRQRSAAEFARQLRRAGVDGGRASRGPAARLVRAPLLGIALAMGGPITASLDDATAKRYVAETALPEARPEPSRRATQPDIATVPARFSPPPMDDLFDRAPDELQREIARLRSLLDRAAPDEWTTRRELARHLTAVGDLPEAAEQWRWLVQQGRSRDAAPRDSAPRGAEVVHHLNLAWVLLEDGKFAEAERTLAPLADSLAGGAGDGHLGAFAGAGLACARLARGDCHAAAEMLHRAVPALERELGRHSRRTQLALCALREASQRCGDARDAASADARLLHPPVPSVARLQAALRAAQRTP